MSVTFPFQTGAGSEDERPPGTMYRDENDDIWVVLADSSVVQVGAGGGSQPLTLTFALDTSGGSGPTTIEGAVSYSATAGEYTQVVWQGVDGSGNAWFANGVTYNYNPGYFYGGTVLILADGTPEWFIFEDGSVILSSGVPYTLAVNGSILAAAAVAAFDAVDYAQPALPTTLDEAIAVLVTAGLCAAS